MLLFCFFVFRGGGNKICFFAFLALGLPPGSQTFLLFCFFALGRSRGEQNILLFCFFGQKAKKQNMLTQEKAKMNKSGLGGLKTMKQKSKIF